MGSGDKQLREAQKELARCERETREARSELQQCEAQRNRAGMKLSEFKTLRDRLQRLYEQALERQCDDDDMFREG